MASRVLALLALVAFVAADQPVQTVTLHNAAQKDMQMPIVGIGTGGYGRPGIQNGEIWNNSVAEKAVFEFLKAGGRRIDTSLLYNTQEGVGNGWTKSGVARKDIFITSKCDDPNFGMIPGGFNATIASAELTLQQLQTDYLDLLLIHWPGQASPPAKTPDCWKPPNNWTECRRETWRALVELFKQRKARAIGVSNFEINHLQDIFDMQIGKPAVNQFEYHPYWHTDDLVEFCIQHDIQVNGYSPLGAPDHMAFHKDKMPILLPNNEVVKRIASRLNRTPGQVILRWELQKAKAVVNPRTQNPQHMKDNLNFFDFSLTDEDMKDLAALNNPPHNVCGDPHLIP